MPRQLLFVFLFIFSCHAGFAQNEKNFSSFRGFEVMPECETYDNALLFSVRKAYYDSTFNSSYIIKQGLEGQEKWRIRLNNFLIREVIRTADSGFAVCGTVNMYPGAPVILDPDVDSLDNVCVLKFDKCAGWQWGRYVPSHTYNVAVGLAEGKNSEIFLYAYGINGYDEIKSKPTTIIKLDKQGALLKYRSFDGIDGKIQRSVTDDYIYLTTMVALPRRNDTNTVCSYIGIKKLDYDLNIINKAYPGYSDEYVNTSGNLVVTKDNVLCVSHIHALVGSAKPTLMFTNLDKSFRLDSGFAFAYDDGYELYPFAVSKLGDTIAVLSQAQKTDASWTFHSSLRLYDKEFKLLKETKVTKTSWIFPYKLIPLSGSQRIMTGLVHNDGDPSALSSIYLYDHSLEPLSFPTTPPSNGYDWDCHTSIPASQEFDVNKKVTPIQVKRDTDRPDWDFLLSVREPEPQHIGRLSQGWLIWPQPATNSTELRVKALALPNQNSNHPLQARFYDMQGRLVATLPAIPEGTGQWVIHSPDLHSQGLFLVDLMDAHSGVSVGRIKVLVE